MMPSSLRVCVHSSKHCARGFSASLIRRTHETHLLEDASHEPDSMRLGGAGRSYHKPAAAIVESGIKQAPSIDAFSRYMTTNMLKGANMKGGQSANEGSNVI